MKPNRDPRRADIKDLIDNVEINRRWSSPFVKMTSGWIFEGLPDTTELIPKDGINKMEALDHVSRIVNSSKLNHDDRVYHGAHLLSIWFEPIK